jgi:amino acid permease
MLTLFTYFLQAYLVVIVIACYFRPIKGMVPPGEIHFIKFTPSFVSTFPIQVFAFTCAQNVASHSLPDDAIIISNGRTAIPHLQRAQD